MTKLNKSKKENKKSLEKITEEYYENRKKTDPPYKLGEGRKDFDAFPPGYNP